MTDLPTSLPCKHARLRQVHGPHGWEPQPGMDPVHCPGHGQPAATEATDAAALRRLESCAVIAALKALHAQGEGGLPMPAVEAMAKAVVAETAPDLGRYREWLARELAKAEHADQVTRDRGGIPDELRISPHNGIAAGLRTALAGLDQHLGAMGAETGRRA
ncbi:hypothetical protein OIE75_29505 [Streptomyces sp. NBC_01723]|uniref:hypothetical protein n=1 Tax=Streptomyces sp. NBC_01723 TaxID=2975921 RepID=UPI002E3643E0|nr:hypothetical protein [Streptomyces sp. NBC_01723]